MRRCSGHRRRIRSAGPGAGSQSDGGEAISSGGGGPSGDGRGWPGRLPGTAGFLLARAAGRAIRDLNRALEPYGLRARHYTVLAAAAAHGGMSQRDLGALLGVDPSAVVALVDDLERAGLARREVHPGDRRTRLIVATGAGAGLLATAQDLAGRADRDLLAPLTAAEQVTLISLLRRITG